MREETRTVDPPAAGTERRRRSGILLRGFGAVVGLAAAVYVAAAGYLFIVQRDYIFKPGGTLAVPAELDLGRVEIVTIRTADETVLTGWYAAARPGLPTLLYFHGNAGNLSERAERFEQVLASGFGLLAVSYRGYPGSGGSPSQVTFFSDALEIFDWLATRTKDIVIHGESLGAAVATYVAAERPGRALVLEAPVTAALDIAAATYPWIPVSLLMRDPFVSREHIKRVEEPVLVIHGTRDRVVPVEHGRRLFEAARQPKRLATVQGGRHSDLWDRGLWSTVLEFLDENGVDSQAAVRRIPSRAG
jgi:fermentation-respiration switch protein FrsA (DUF1100 family)